MTELRISVSVILMLMAVYIAVMNWGCAIASERNRRKKIDKHVSTVPLITFILAGLAYEVYPFSPKGWIGIIPAVDIGNWMLVIGLPWAIAKGAFRKGPPNKTSDATSEPAPGADSSAHQG